MYSYGVKIWTLQGPALRVYIRSETMAGCIDISLRTANEYGRDQQGLLLTLVKAPALYPGETTRQISAATSVRFRPGGTTQGC